MRSYYSEGGLRKWVSEKWVDIGAPKKNGKYQRKNIYIMNLEKDLKELRRQKQLKESAIAQLRKRSKDSNARPRAEKNMLSNNPNLQKI